MSAKALDRGSRYVQINCLVSLSPHALLVCVVWSLFRNQADFRLYNKQIFFVESRQWRMGSLVLTSAF
jgi:hypothetical protein